MNLFSVIGISAELDMETERLLEAAALFETLHQKRLNSLQHLCFLFYIGQVSHNFNLSSSPHHDRRGSREREFIPTLYTGSRFFPSLSTNAGRINLGISLSMIKHHGTLQAFLFTHQACLGGL